MNIIHMKRKLLPYSICMRFDGTPTNEFGYIQDIMGLQLFLDDWGIKYFSAKELATPNHTDVANKLGYEYLIPILTEWPWLAALCKLADKLRLMCGNSVHCYNSYRPRKYNEKVGGAKDSDHLYSQAIDLDFKDPSLTRHIEAYLLKLQETEPWLEMSLGLGLHKIHVGLGRKKRTWHYSSHPDYKGK